MAKRAKNLLALVLALALCAAQVAIPVSASELTDPDDASAKVPVMEVTVEVIENGSQKVTTTTDPETGATVITTETSTTTQDPDGSVVDTQTTVVETDLTTEEYGIYEHTDTTQTQQTQTTTQQIPGSTEADEDGFTSQGGTQTTVVETEEEQTDVVMDDGGDFLMYESSQGAGSETTTVTNTEVKTHQETTDPTSTITDAPYEVVSHDPGSYTPSEPDVSGGEAVYEDAVIGQEPGDVTLEMSQKDREDSEVIQLDVEEVLEDNLDIPPEGTTSRTNEDGSETITQVIYTRDGSGQVIGYTVTVTTVVTHVSEDEEHTTVTTVPGEGDGTVTQLPTETATEETFTLPAKPEGGIRWDERGDMVTTVVDEILDGQGAVIGYKATTTVTDMYGQVLRSSSETVLGTTTTTIVTTEKTETKNVTDVILTKDRVTTTTYTKITDYEGKELVILNGQWYYKAELDAVKEGKAHGSTEVIPVTPTDVVLYYADGSRKIGTFDRVDNTTESSGDRITPNDQYSVLYDGVRAEGSNYNVNTSDGSSWAHTFQLKDDQNNTFLVYCIDYATHATPDYEYTMDNIADANYYKGEDAAQHIQGIGLNGYWGSLTGIGSLQHVKDQLQAAYNASVEAGTSFILTKAQVDDLVRNLTEGEALTATQAAFWQYGNSGNVTVSRTQQTDRITNLMNWLASVKAPLNNSTDMIDKEDFAQNASITVKDKVSDGNGSEPAAYNTDITFSLAVQTDKHSDDLLVHVIVEGKVIETRRLAGSNSKEQAFDSVISDGKGNYTIEDLVLTSGVSLTLNLTGTQHIEEGVYIYTSELIEKQPSQTFVGLAEGERNVDLSVSMNFSVTEPEVQVLDPVAAPEQVRTETLVERKTDIRTMTSLTCDTKVTTVVSQETGRAWDHYEQIEYRWPWEPTPYDDEYEIPDEDVPLADVPATGDSTMLYAIISCISVGGIFLLNKKRKDEA